MNRPPQPSTMRRPVPLAVAVLLGGLWLDAFASAAQANRKRFDPHPYGQHSKSQHRAYRYDQEYYGFREQPAPSPRVLRPRPAPPTKQPTEPALPKK